jgi:hypothetical protein
LEGNKSRAQAFTRTLETIEENIESVFDDLVGGGGAVTAGGIGAVATGLTGASSIAATGAGAGGATASLSSLLGVGSRTPHTSQLSNTASRVLQNANRARSRMLECGKKDVTALLEKARSITNIPGPGAIASKIKSVVNSLRTTRIDGRSVLAVGGTAVALPATFAGVALAGINKSTSLGLNISATHIGRGSFAIDLGGGVELELGLNNVISVGNKKYVSISPGSFVKLVYKQNGYEMETAFKLGVSAQASSPSFTADLSKVVVKASAKGKEKCLQALAELVKQTGWLSPLTKTLDSKFDDVSISPTSVIEASFAVDLRPGKSGSVDMIFAAGFELKAKKSLGSKVDLVAKDTFLINVGISTKKKVTYSIPSDSSNSSNNNGNNNNNNNNNIGSGTSGPRPTNGSSSSNNNNGSSGPRSTNGSSGPR